MINTRWFDFVYSLIILSYNFYSNHISIPNTSIFSYNLVMSRPYTRYNSRSVINGACFSQSRKIEDVHDQKIFLTMT